MAYADSQSRNLSLPLSHSVLFIYVANELSCSISNVFQKETTQKFWRFNKILTMSLKVRNQILTVTEDPLSTDKVPVPFEDAGGGDGRPIVDEVQKFCGSWKAASHFTPPGPAVCFDESQSGVQPPLPFPPEAECFKLFLTEELVGDIVETKRYALELQEKSQEWGGQPQLVKCTPSW